MRADGQVVVVRINQFERKHYSVLRWLGSLPADVSIAKLNFLMQSHYPVISSLSAVAQGVLPCGFFGYFFLSWPSLRFCRPGPRRPSSRRRRQPMWAQIWVDRALLALFQPTFLLPIQARLRSQSAAQPQAASLPCFRSPESRRMSHNRSLRGKLTLFLY